MISETTAMAEHSLCRKVAPAVLVLSLVRFPGGLFVDRSEIHDGTYPIVPIGLNNSPVGPLHRLRIADEPLRLLGKIAI